MKIVDGQLQLAEQIRTEWCISLPEEGTIEDVLKSSTYAHVTKRLRKGAIIEVTAYDGSWWARVLVRAVDGLDVVLGLLSEVKFPEVTGHDESEYEIKHRGAAKWCVLRCVDKAIMVEGLASKDAALAWLKNPPAKLAA